MAKKHLWEYKSKVTGPRAAGPQAALRNNAMIQDSYLAERQEFRTAPSDALKKKMVRRGIKHNAAKSVAKGISKGILKGGLAKGIGKRVLGGLIPGVGIALAANDANAAVNYVKKKAATYPKGPVRKRTATGKSARGRGGRR